MEQDERGVAHPATGGQGTPPESRRRRFMTPVERAVGLERVIREAADRGEFDNLPGKGKPLRFDDDPWAGDWGMAFHVLKNAGETLPWIPLGKEIDADREQLRTYLEQASARLGAMRVQVVSEQDRRAYETQRLAARARYLDAAAKLDEKMGEYNFLVPSYRLDRGRLPQRIAAERFDAACPPMAPKL